MAKGKPTNVVDYMTASSTRENANGERKHAVFQGAVADIFVPRKPIVPTGPVYIRRNVLDLVEAEDLFPALGRHYIGDWGNVESEACASNERALREGGKVLSSYFSRCGIEFWVTTDVATGETLVLIAYDI